MEVNHHTTHYHKRRLDAFVRKRKQKRCMTKQKKQDRLEVPSVFPHFTFPEQNTGTVRLGDQDRHRSSTRLLLTLIPDCAVMPGIGTEYCHCSVRCLPSYESPMIPVSGLVFALGIPQHGLQLCMISHLHLHGTTLHSSRLFRFETRSQQQPR